MLVRMGALENHSYLTMINGMAAYSGTILLMFIGLVLFFKNVEEGFVVSFFWRRKSGKEHVRECWVDKKIWEKSCKTKDDERWS